MGKSYKTENFRYGTIVYFEVESDRDMNKSLIQK